MLTKKQKHQYRILLVLLVLLGLGSFCPQLWLGFFKAADLATPALYPNSLWLSLFVVLMMFFILLQGYRHAWTWLLSKGFLFLLLLTFVGTSIIGLQRAPQDTMLGNIHNISLTSLQNIQQNKASGLYYIGRKDCGACQTLFPLLVQLSNQYQVTIMYYDTQGDRETRQEAMLSVLHTLSVTEVPAMVLVEQGNIKQVWQGSEVAGQIQQYLWDMNQGKSPIFTAR